MIFFFNVWGVYVMKLGWIVEVGSLFCAMVVGIDSIWEEKERSEE
jgi:hypothetical protein